MKISNETKVGALTAIAITLLILGFNFLKGKTFTSKNGMYYAVFNNIQGLTNGNPIFINGKQVGAVYNTDGGKDMRQITVTMNMNEDLTIPDNSVAIITPSILGTTTLDIKLGNSRSYYKNKDTISTQASASMFDEALEKLDPVLFQVKNAVKSLDSLLNAVNGLLDAQTKGNFKHTIENLSITTGHLSTASASMKTMLDAQNGVVAKTMENVHSITANLKNNNEKVDNIMTNVQTSTANLSKLDFEKTLNTLNATITDLKSTIGVINSDKGSLGKLINDNTLYNNLNATTYKVNTLLDDFRMHPKRYVSFSVFGKKDKGTPLSAPLPIDTAAAVIP